MTIEPQNDVPPDLFKDVTYYIVGDISEDVRKLSFVVWQNSGWGICISLFLGLYMLSAVLK